LHGLGDTAEGWASAAYMMAHRLTHVQFVLPTASNIPVTLNGGVAMPAWSPANKSTLLIGIIIRRLSLYFIIRYDLAGLGSRADEKCEVLSFNSTRN